MLSLVEFIPNQLGNRSNTNTISDISELLEDATRVGPAKRAKPEEEKLNTIPFSRNHSMLFSDFPHSFPGKIEGQSRAEMGWLPKAKRVFSPGGLQKIGKNTPTTSEKCEMPGKKPTRVENKTRSGEEKQIIHALFPQLAGKFGWVPGWTTPSGPGKIWERPSFSVDGDDSDLISNDCYARGLAG